MSLERLFRYTVIPHRAQPATLLEHVGKHHIFMSTSNPKNRLSFNADLALTGRASGYVVPAGGPTKHARRRTLAARIHPCFTQRLRHREFPRIGASMDCPLTVRPDAAR